jgi:uncharacterized protein (DUF488 family)
VATPLCLYTIGHSNHGLIEFVALLQRHGVRRLVDVRSNPYSRWARHFCQVPLAEGLKAAGVDYVFMGETLGGRPSGSEFYGTDGKCDYLRRARAAEFRAGIESLLGMAADRTTAIMCAEEDPGRCHRRALIAPSLLARGVDVVHIRGDARLQPEVAGRSPDGQLPLLP